MGEFMYQLLSLTFDIPTDRDQLGKKAWEVTRVYLPTVLGLLCGFKASSLVNLRYWIGAKALPAPMKGAVALPSSKAFAKLCFGTWFAGGVFYYLTDMGKENSNFAWWSILVFPVLYIAILAEFLSSSLPISMHRTTDGGVVSVFSQAPSLRRSVKGLTIFSFLLTTIALNHANKVNSLKSVLPVEPGALLSFISSAGIVFLFSLGSPGTSAKGKNIAFWKIMLGHLCMGLYFFFTIPTAIQIGRGELFNEPSSKVHGETPAIIYSFLAFANSKAGYTLIRTAFIPFCAAYTARMLGLLLRVDYESRPVTLDTSFELEPVTLQSIPPTKRNGAIEDGLLIPASLPKTLKFRKTYYRTATLAWLLSMLSMAFVLPSSIVTVYYVLPIAYVCMCATFLPVALVKGGWEEVKRVFGHVEAEWKIEPVELPTVVVTESEVNVAVEEKGEEEKKELEAALLL